MATSKEVISRRNTLTKLKYSAPSVHIPTKCQELKKTSASVTSLQAQELTAQQIPELPEQGRGGRRGAPDPAGQVRRHPHIPD